MIMVFRALSSLFAIFEGTTLLNLFLRTQKAFQIKDFP